MDKRAELYAPLPDEDLEQIIHRIWQDLRPGPQGQSQGRISYLYTDPRFRTLSQGERDWPGAHDYQVHKQAQDPSWPVSNQPLVELSHPALREVQDLIGHAESEEGGPRPPSALTGSPFILSWDPELRRRMRLRAPTWPAPLPGAQPGAPPVLPSRMVPNPLVVLSRSYLRPPPGRNGGFFQERQVHNVQQLGKRLGLSRDEAREVYEHLTRNAVAVHELAHHRQNTLKGRGGYMERIPVDSAIPGQPPYYVWTRRGHRPLPGGGREPFDYTADTERDANMQMLQDYLKNLVGLDQEAGNHLIDAMTDAPHFETQNRQGYGSYWLNQWRDLHR